MIDKIHYGIGKDYLESWGLNEALREIYQNYKDFGKFRQTKENLGDYYNISLVNDYQPDNFEFLRIGNSQKVNSESIGKHGEGLKMAFLIFHRENLSMTINTGDKEITPSFETTIAGDTLVLKVEGKESKLKQNFTTNFTIPKVAFDKFIKGVIKPVDTIHEDKNYGKIVDKKKGDIYVGGLYVCNIKNFNKAYDFLPSKIPLDRDRRVPGSFDTSWAASKINENLERWEHVDTNFDDHKYVSKVPEHVKKEYKPKIVGNSIEFTKDNNGTTEVLKNDRMKQIFESDSIFTQAINYLKKKLLKGLGVYDLLVKFKETHFLTDKAIEDLDYIISKIEK